MSLRVNVQNVLVTYAVKRFIDNLPAIFDGKFNHALLEDEGEEGRLLQIFKTVARQQVFNHSEVEQLELQGYRVIKGLLEIYQPLMMLNYEAFTTLINEDFYAITRLKRACFISFLENTGKPICIKCARWLLNINMSVYYGSGIIGFA